MEIKIPGRPSVGALRNYYYSWYYESPRDLGISTCLQHELLVKHLAKSANRRNPLRSSSSGNSHKIETQHFCFVAQTTNRPSLPFLFILTSNINTINHDVQEISSCCRWVWGLSDRPCFCGIERRLNVVEAAGWAADQQSAATLRTT